MFTIKQSHHWWFGHHRHRWYRLFLLRLLVVGLHRVGCRAGHAHVLRVRRLIRLRGLWLLPMRPDWWRNGDLRDSSAALLGSRLWPSRRAHFWRPFSWTDSLRRGRSATEFSWDLHRPPDSVTCSRDTVQRTRSSCQKFWDRKFEEKICATRISTMTAEKVSKVNCDGSTWREQMTFQVHLSSSGQPRWSGAKESVSTFLQRYREGRKPSVKLTKCLAPKKRMWNAMR